jgi:BTB/POZ domain-containing protein KCTD8/12/16
MSDNNNNTNRVVDLNVGGHYYTTTLDTLCSESNSLFQQLFHTSITDNESNTSSSSPSPSSSVPPLIVTKDSNNRIFIDRDGSLFRFILDFLRTKVLVLPENFNEYERLKNEAIYFKLDSLIEKLDCKINEYDQKLMKNLNSNFEASAELSKHTSGCIVVGYRGTFQTGRDGLADVKFRKISRK